MRGRACSPPPLATALLLVASLTAVSVARCETSVLPPGEVSADSLRWFGAERFAVAIDSLRLEPGQTRIDLSHSRVTVFQEVTLDGRSLMVEEEVVLVPDRGLAVLTRAAAGGELFLARYRYESEDLAAQVFLRRPVSAGREGRTDESGPPGPDGVESPQPVGGGFGDLSIDGAKTVSIQGGTNRDATVDQGLNLSVSGQLTEGIGVRAQISDENLPITPEGNTEELSDLDQVRIELFGERGRALLGDFRVDRDLGRFAPYERKLQGLLLEGRSERGRAALLGGAPQGRRLEAELRGREGVQGPYELLDGLRLDQTFVVAGSERVWVDGELLTRGAGRDYVIDYIRGTITFTERRPIGPENRIAVDFETSETGYRRSVIGSTVDSLRWGPALFHLALLREADDPDRPREGSLEPEDREVLAAAGDDPAAALTGGVTPTPPGEGNYVERFTPEGFRFFVAADSAGGDFDVDFLFVGREQGEYRLDGVSEAGVLNFEFVGEGRGDYTVGRRLPLPESTELAVARIEVGDSDGGGWVSGELDLTRFDRNQSSALDDDDNEDLAWAVGAGTPWLLGSAAGSGVRLQGRAERIGGNFRALGRLRAPFFYEAWNLQEDERDRTEDYQEIRGEWGAAARRTELAWEHLAREGRYDGRRLQWRGGGAVLGPLRWSHGLAETVADRESSDGSTRASRRRDRSLGTSWEQWQLVPFATVQDERFRDERAQRAMGYRSEGWSAGLRGRGGGRLVFHRTLADSLSADGERWRFARDVRRAEAAVERQWGSTRVELDFSWRHTLLPEELEETTRLARVRGAHRDEGRGLQLEVDYRAGTDQSRVLGRQVVFVGFGEGDYDIEGNPVGVRQGDYNVVFTPSDSLVSSTEVELTANVGWRPDLDWAAGFSSQTLVQVRERSRTEDVGALLRLSPDLLLDPELTLFGEQRLREELVLLRDLRNVDLRLTWESFEALDQRFTQGPERTSDERARAQTEIDLGGGISLRVDGAQQERSRSTTSEVNPLLRSYDVRDRTAGTLLRWRLDARRRVGVELRWTRRRERSNGIEQRVLEAIPSAGTELLGGRWNVETRLVQVTEDGGSDLTRPFFFERPGTGRSASVVAQWGGSGGLTVSLRYQLRDEPDRKLRHDLAAETRVRF